MTALVAERPRDLPMPLPPVPPPEIIFKQDEFTIQIVRPEWDKEKMLEQRGLFYGHAVCKKLDIDRSEIQRIHKSFGTKWKLAYALTGIRKVWRTWYINMTVFAGYYINYMEQTPT